MQHDARDAIRVQDHDDDERDATDRDQPRTEIDPVERNRTHASRREVATEHRAEHPADPAGDRVADGVDRLERVVAPVDDGRVLEREEDPCERRDGSADGEGVELGAEDADPERRGGSLVVAHSDEPSPRARATQVGHDQRRDHEHREAHDQVAVGVVGRADIPTEHLDLADRRDRSEVTGEELVAEDHLLDGEPEPERDDGEVHTPRAQRGDREHHAHEDGEHDPDEECELGGPVLVPDEARREERAESTDRVLRERQLTCVSGQHDDRQDEHADDQRRVHRGRPGRVEREAVQKQQGTDGDDEEPAGHDTGAEVREPLEDVAAQRERLAADHEHDDDHEERQRALEAGRTVLDPERVVQEIGDVTRVGEDFALSDPERDATEQRERERAESADQRDGERRHGHHDREDGQAEAGVGCEQDPGQSRGRAPDRPGDGGEQVRRPAERGHRPLVLRARGDREADRREPRERPQEERRRARDPEQDQAILLDDHASHLAVEAEPVVQRVVVRGEELVDLVEVAVPELLTRESLEDDQHTEGGDEPHERRGGAHEAEDAVLDGDAEQRGQENGDRDRGPDRPSVFFDQREEAEERREHRDRAVREVDDAGAAVDENDALRQQCVCRSRAETEDRELDGLGHDLCSERHAGPPTRSTGRHWRYCVTSIGCLLVTTVLPLKRET